jgi:hypothetical protein
MKVVERSQLPQDIETHLGHWLERINVSNRQRPKIAQLDQTKVYLADDGAHTPTITGARLAARARVTAAITVQPPPNAEPNDRFRFDIIQRSEGRIVGGCTYVLGIAGKH